MVELSKRNAAKEGVSDKATFMKADLFESDFSQAQVITMFLLPSINLKLRPKILDLKPGTRIVSNSFDMEEWKPDETAKVEGCTNWCTAHFWIVPAKVGGTWKLPQGELAIKQTFQMITGTLKNGNVASPINGKLNRRSDHLYRGRHSIHRPGQRQFHGRQRRRSQVERDARKVEPQSRPDPRSPHFPPCAARFHERAAHF